MVDSSASHPLVNGQRQAIRRNQADVAITARSTLETRRRTLRARLLAGYDWLKAWWLLLVCAGAALMGATLIFYSIDKASQIAHAQQAAAEQRAQLDSALIRANMAPQGAVVFEWSPSQQPVWAVLSGPLTSTPPVTVAQVSGVTTAGMSSDVANAPALPDFMDTNCAFNALRIIQGESGPVSSALDFLAEAVVWSAHDRGCTAIANGKLWTGIANVPSGTSIRPEVRAALNTVLARWPERLWPACQYIGSMSDVTTWIADSVRLSHDAPRIGVAFTSPDHRWAVLGVNCSEAK
jgi:hypothetical protein